MPAQNRTTSQERRGPLSARQVEEMLVQIIRREPLLQIASTQLSGDLFPQPLLHLAIVYDVIVKFYRQYRTLPTENAVIGEVERRQEALAMVAYVDWNMLDDFVKRAYAVPLNSPFFSDANMRVALHHLQLFVQDGLALKIRQDLIDNPATPVDLTGQLRRYAIAAEQTESIQHGSLPCPFPTGWTEGGIGIEKVPLGIPFLEQFLGGGAARKEVLGLLGPIGSCKTLLTIQLTTQFAKLAYDNWMHNGRRTPLDMVYLFIYEGSIEEMRLRALAHDGVIDRAVLEDWNPARLSRAGRLKEYERKLFGADFQNGRAFPGEYERMMLSSQRLNWNWRCVDMTGNDIQHPGRGGGLTDEVISIIDADQRANHARGFNTRVGLVAIDYVGAAAEQYCAMRNLKRDSELRGLLQNVPLQFKNNLASKYNAVVWLVHQLSGKANELLPGRPAKATDAQECKSFKMNLDFCFVLANPNREQLTTVVCEKHRRRPPHDALVVRIDGALGRVLSDTRYVFNYDRRAIESREEHRILAGPVSPPPVQNRQNELFVHNQPGLV